MILSNGSIHSTFQKDECSSPVASDPKYYLVWQLHPHFLIKPFPLQYNSGYGISKFYNLKMRSHNLSVLGFILLATWANSTMIITDKAPAMLDIGGGDTMLVFDEDEDIGEDDLSALSQAREAAASSGTQEATQQPTEATQQPTTVYEPTYVSEPTAQPTQKAATKIQQQSQTTQSTFFDRSHTTYLRMFSSFGGLGQRSDEADYRKLVHQNNMKWMEDEDKKGKQKGRKFSMAENQFSMLTLDEFKGLYLNLQVPGEVPKFDFDFKKEIEKFIHVDEQFIDRFFNTHLDWNSPHHQADSFDFGFGQQQDHQAIKPTSLPEPDVQPTPTPVEPEVTPTPVEPEVTPTPVEPEVTPVEPEVTPTKPEVTPSES